MFNRNERQGFLSLGSNMGDPEANLRQAVEAIRHEPSIRVDACSSVFWTEPQGMRDQQWFANMALSIRTDEHPEDLLRTVQKIEITMGRVRTQKWGPRTIDIDILLLGELKCNFADITIPHPRMCERAFVLVPLAQLAPDCIVNGQSVEYWLKSLSYSLEGNRIWQAEGSTIRGL